MSIDLWFGKTQRTWSRASQLTSDPLTTTAPIANLPDPSKSVKKTIAQILEPGIRVEKHGRGAVISKKWKWG